MCSEHVRLAWGGTWLCIKGWTHMCIAHGSSFSALRKIFCLLKSICAWHLISILIHAEWIARWQTASGKCTRTHSNFLPQKQSVLALLSNFLNAVASCALHFGRSSGRRWHTGVHQALTPAIKTKRNIMAAMAAMLLFCIWWLMRIWKSDMYFVCM